MSDDFFRPGSVRLTTKALDSIAATVSGLPNLIPALVWTRSFEGHQGEERLLHAGFHLCIYSRDALPANAIETRGSLEIAFVKWLPVDPDVLIGKIIDKVNGLFVLVDDN